MIVLLSAMVYLGFHICIVVRFKYTIISGLTEEYPYVSQLLALEQANRQLPCQQIWQKSQLLYKWKYGHSIWVATQTELLLSSCYEGYNRASVLVSILI